MAEHKAHLPSSVRLDHLEAELDGAGQLLEQLRAYEDRLEQLERRPAGQQLTAEADPGLEQLRTDLAATRADLAELSRRLTSLARHVMSLKPAAPAAGGD